MDTLVLSDGKEITFDLSKVTHKEFIEFWKDGATDEIRDAFFVKVSGWSMDEIDSLPETDWRSFRATFNNVCFRPLEKHAKN